MLVLDVLYITGDWNAKVGSQETPGVTGKFGLGVQNKAGQRLREFCQENTLVIANTLFQEHKRRLYTGTSPNGQYQSQIDYILCSQGWETLYSQQKQDWEMTVAQIMNFLFPSSDLKEVGKTTRPFRYDLNQIPYNYTVKVTNSFKGLDLIDRVPEELWMEVHNIVQEAVIKTIPKKKKCKKVKWLSQKALQMTEKRRKVKRKEGKERYTHLNAECQRIARRDKKAFLSDLQRNRGKEQNGKD